MPISCIRYPLTPVHIARNMSNTSISRKMQVNALYLMPVKMQLIRYLFFVGACKQECIHKASNRSTTGAYYGCIDLAKSLFHVKFGR